MKGKFSIIPEDIQFSLLEKHVGVNVVHKVREDYQKRISDLQVVRKGEEEIISLGWGTPQGYYYLAHNFEGEIISEGRVGLESKESIMPWKFRIPLYTLSIIGIPFLIREALPSQRVAEKNSVRIYELRKNLFDANMQEVEKLVEPIKIYQEPISEVEKQLEVSLEIVDTGKTENNLEAKEMIYLKAHAAFLGADALVNYILSSSENRYSYWDYDWKDYMTKSYTTVKHLGTPVKIVQK